ncbi:Outer membrane protein assembly factor BamE precursor [Candidatus Arsenophonus lipoptenae]|uniref:Outer membrane protein assembly factor BamE n=1 Tax=Candidatus Arsenophonus lipoptenae TaxID=634113 RepID=A0A0X9VEL0_9GAMM|nr:outer membrane protein assembly factor BamE [Candidatus Arsenophonus lipoptenae]AMA65049.1 Outer membrane protein assembly factor BamE precursor [Candidatus Arsenophonus lipoptenae]
MLSKYCKLLFLIVVFIQVITSCSIFERIVYIPNISQGNYLSFNDIAKIQKGMTKQQVIYILGTPVFKELFGQHIWYYIFRQHIGSKKVKQQTLILFFNQNDILISIKNNNNLR